jgi:hypothetical protein
VTADRTSGGVGCGVSLLSDFVGRGIWKNTNEFLRDFFTVTQNHEFDPLFRNRINYGEIPAD